MRTLVATLVVAAGLCGGGPAAWAQYSPHIAESSEVGVELRLGDEIVSFAGIFQTPVGTRTDARAGFGIASPDQGDSEVFLTGGLRTLLSRRTSRFPLDIALDAQLDLFLSEEAGFGLTVGPSFGGRVGSTGALVAYVQPVILYVNDGESDADFGVRLGADYELTPTVDLRGDILVANDAELRAAVYFKL